MNVSIEQRVMMIYDFIEHYQQEYKRSPKIVEIAGAVISHEKTVRADLATMERIGMIECTKTTRWQFRLISRKANWTALVTPEPGEVLRV